MYMAFHWRADDDSAGWLCDFSVARTSTYMETYSFVIFQGGSRHPCLPSPSGFAHENGIPCHPKIMDNISYKIIQTHMVVQLFIVDSKFSEI